MIYASISISYIKRKTQGIMNEEIIQNLNERLDMAIGRGRVMLEDEELQKRLEELKERSENIIRRHPIKSVTIGLAVGFIVAKIFTSDD